MRPLVPITAWCTTPCNPYGLEEEPCGNYFVLDKRGREYRNDYMVVFRYFDDERNPTTQLAEVDSLVFKISPGFAVPAVKVEENGQFVIHISEDAHRLADECLPRHEIERDTPVQNQHPEK